MKLRSRLLSRDTVRPAMTMKIKRYSILSFCILSITTLCLSYPRHIFAPNAAAGDPSQQLERSAPLPPANIPVYSSAPTVAVFRFAVQSSPANQGQLLSTRACLAADPATSDSQSSSNVTVKPKTLDAITKEMEKQLSKKMNVLVDPVEGDIPNGAFVISGCVIKASGGNTAGRLIGMNVGSSHLGLHVVLLSKVDSALTQVDDFELQVRGGNLLPPLGPVGLGLHLATDSRHTLSADAKKLARQIVKRLFRDMKART